MKYLLIACLSTLLPVLAPAQLKWGLVPSEMAAQESLMTFELIAFNPTDQDLPFVSQQDLPATLYTGGNQLPVRLWGEEGAPQIIAPGESVSRIYRLQLPATRSDHAFLETQAPSGENVSAVIRVARPQVPATVGPPVPLGALGGGRRDDESVDVLQSFVDRFSLHEPIYVVYGNEDLAAKFQISFKYRVLRFDGNKEGPIARSLQLAYTQRSLWDFDGASSPFYDTSYMPAAFYEWIRPLEKSKGSFRWLGLQSGVRHESNGQSGNDSRSLNTLFIRSAWSIGSLDSWHLLIMPEAWIYVGGLSDNEAIRDYRGYGQLRAVFGKAGGPALAYTGGIGRDFDNVTTQLDLTLPVKIAFLDFGTYFLVQYFNGYGENLLDYDVRTNSLRFGISLVR